MIPLYLQIAAQRYACSLCGLGAVILLDGMGRSFVGCPTHKEARLEPRYYRQTPDGAHLAFEADAERARRTHRAPALPTTDAEWDRIRERLSE